MAILSKGTDFTTGDQVTAAKLDALVDSATFASGAVDDSTTALDGSGRIIVKDGGITSAKLNLTANVGINTSNPEAALHVNDIGSTQPCILVENASSTEGDIAVSSGEALQMGHWSGSAFTNRFQFNNTGVAEVFGSDSTGNSILILNSTGTDDTSALMFSNQVDGDDDVGQISYDHTNNVMKFRVNAAEKMRILTNDGLVVGQTTSATTVDGSIFCAGRMGTLFTATDSAAATSEAANVNIASSGLFRKSTSSARYKKNIEDYTKGIDEVKLLRPVSFQSNNEEDSDKTYAGLIAEEVHDAGLTEFVDYNEEGQPDAIHYSNMVSLLTKALQESLTKIESLEARVASLES